MALRYGSRVMQAHSTDSVNTPKGRLMNPSFQAQTDGAFQDRFTAYFVGAGEHRGWNRKRQESIGNCGTCQSKPACIEGALL